MKKCLLALLLAALLIWLYALINMSLWQDRLQQKIDQLAASSLAQNHPESKPITPPETSVALSDIALPSVPNKAEQQTPPVTTMNPPEQVTKPVNEALSIAAQPKADAGPKPELPAPQPSTKTITPPITQQTAQPMTPPAQPQSADEVYQQLQSDQSLDLQIALPANATQRNQLLDYLYQCAGMQFAVLQPAQRTQNVQSAQQQLRYLSPKRYVPLSQWLRVANGALSSGEQQWLAKQSGTAIRIFPQVIDQRLSHYLATSLQGKKLRSLRASYSLNTTGLILNNIQLNKQNINSTWQLHNSQCAI